MLFLGGSTAMFPSQVIVPGQALLKIQQHKQTYIASHETLLERLPSL